MLVSSGKFIGPMVHSIMLLISNIYESIISRPTITIDLCIFNLHFSSNDRYESFSFYIRNYFCIYFSVSFEESEYYCLHSSSSSSLSSYSSRSEVGLINFNRSCPDFCFFCFTESRNSLS
jgi:hypothetical protein